MGRMKEYIIDQLDKSIRIAGIDPAAADEIMEYKCDIGIDIMDFIQELHSVAGHRTHNGRVFMFDDYDIVTEEELREEYARDMEDINESYEVSNFDDFIGALMDTGGTLRDISAA